MKKSNVILIWGVGTAVVTAIFSQVLSISDNPNSGVRYFAYLILFGGLFVGLLQYRKANGGYLKFGEGFGAAMLMTLIVAFISVISLFIVLKSQPGYIDKILTLAQQNMVNKGFTQDQIDTNMKYARIFTTPRMLYIFSFIGSLIGGAIFSLIAAGLASKQKPIFEDADEMPNHETNN